MVIALECTRTDCRSLFPHLDRFDLIYLIIDRVDPAEDERLGKHIVAMYDDQAEQRQAEEIVRLFSETPASSLLSVLICRPFLPSALAIFLVRSICLAAICPLTQLE